ncbi:MAG: PCP reductase family protein [Candidatus Dormibacteria bacterium]
MSESELQKCPFPGFDNQPDGGSQGVDGDAAGTCPAPHAGQPQWDLEAHIEAIRRAQKSAGTSHLETARAEEMAVKVAEQRAAQKGLGEIRSEFLNTLGKKLGYGHPLSDRTGLPQFVWTEAAEARLAEVPAFCRDLTRWRVEWTALKQGLGTTITPEIMDVKYQMWGEVSHAIQARREQELPWTDSARSRFDKVPDFVKGQVLEAVEGNARQMGVREVDDEVVNSVISRWSSTGDFHEGLYGFR